MTSVGAIAYSVRHFVVCSARDVMVQFVRPLLFRGSGLVKKKSSQHLSHNTRFWLKHQNQRSNFTGRDVQWANGMKIFFRLHSAH